MITLLHGDNIEASRRELNELRAKAKGKEVRELEGRTVDAGLLTQALESSSLFGGEILVVIENLFGKLGKKAKLIEELSQILVQAKDGATIILWENKEVGKTVTSALGTDVTIKLFKTPVIIFQFLDSLKPGNASTLLSLYHELVATNAPELIHAMMNRRIRQLIQLRDGVTPEGLQGWQVGRLTNQAKLFTMEKLLAMYQNLLDIELSIKTGASPFSLSQLLEQYIIDL